MPNDQESLQGTGTSALGSDVPQFATAEYAHIPGTERCRICNNLIAGEYYRVNKQMACSRCALEARNGQPTDSHAAFARAVLYGSGAAVVGLILFATVAIVTGWTIGYLALAVGWIVAKAMMKGSNGMGGRRYQVAAVLLTYFAISLAAIPIGISIAIKNRPVPVAHSQADGQPADANADAQQKASSESKPSASPGAMVVQLLFYGVASPFLELADPLHGIIGLFILFIGLRIAYQLTGARALEVDGPYSATAGVTA